MSIEHYYEKIKPYIDRSITQREEKNLAFLDDLTSLQNRRAFDLRIQSAVLKDICLVSVDANELKKTNDRDGHLAGDSLLISIAKQLQHTFGDENTYRVGGDEFAVILSSDADVDGLILQMKKELFNLKISVAAGFSFGKNALSIEQLIASADELMYRDKRRYHMNKQENTGQIKTMVAECIRFAFFSLLYITILLIF